MIGDPTRIRQVLLNLVSNALKFTHEGSVQVQIDTLTEHENSIGLKFSVIDTGIGISEKAISKMFKAFSQADDSTSRKFGGTGLGLSICKQLVELMGGKIGLYSTEGHGSTFWFELSFEKGRELKIFRNATQVNFAHVRYNGHVLVADDNLINQKVISKTLSKLGLKVDLAENGKQVLAALDKNPLYNLVFMDCHMPELDGFETTHRIRSNIKAAYNKIPIVALTANLLNAAKDKCLQAGMNDFLSKPIEDQKLHEVLAKFLEKSDNAKVVSNDTHDTPKPNTEFSSVDLAILEKLNALQEEGEPDIIVELIHSFLSQTPTRLNAMATALAVADEASYETIYDEAHTIKSCARTMGGKHLGELCQELEDLRNSTSSEKVKSLCNNIQNEYLKMAHELNLIIGLRQQNKVA